MTYLGIYFACFAIWITANLLTAPKGWEDDRGFHYGKQPKEDNKTNKARMSVQALNNFSTN